MPSFKGYIVEYYWMLIAVSLMGEDVEEPCFLAPGDIQWVLVLLHKCL